MDLARAKGEALDNIIHYSSSLFFTAAHFHLALVAASISHFVMLSFQQKNVSFVFLSLALDLCRLFSL